MCVFNVAFSGKPTSYVYTVFHYAASCDTIADSMHLLLQFKKKVSELCEEMQY
jgi:hypothetical protein